MKSKCWQKHSVNIKVKDNISDNLVMKEITIAKDVLWVRKEFDCQPRQGLLYEASASQIKVCFMRSPAHK